MLESICWIQHSERNRSRKEKKNGDKYRKASYKLMKMLLIVSSGKLKE